jgi:hypothetical protein
MESHSDYMKTIFLFVISCLFVAESLFCQNYQAMHGSSYAGSLGVSNNPASIVHTPYAWDVNLFSAQLKSTTNTFRVLKYSLSSVPDEVELEAINGDFGRRLNSNLDLHLLNTRISIGRYQAVAFGLNLRSHNHFKTSPFNFQDTISSLRSFLMMNVARPEVKGEATSSTWLELYGSYARTISDQATHRLNAGVTVKLQKGLSGAYARLARLRVERVVRDTIIDFVINGGASRYAYSSNYDKWNQNAATSENVKNFVNAAQGGLSVDLGMEYIVKTQEVMSVFDEDDFYNYEWKIGISLLDMGFNQYRHSINSRSHSQPKSNISDVEIENKFTGVTNIQDFNDSIALVVNSSSALPGNFMVMNPMRMVINVDRHLFDDYYINGELSANLSPLAGEDRLYTTGLNFLTVTPRWENRRWGVYLPLQVNAAGRFWFGGAFKAGPLLLGVHNLANVFVKNNIQNGGAYLALVIRPGKNSGDRRDKRLNCPE